MTRKLDVQDLLAFQLAGDVQMAPAGERAAFVISRIDKEKNETQTSIHMVAPGQAAVRFTGGESDSSPRFSPDGSKLAFLSRRSGQTQIWLMDLTGGEARQLTKIQGGVGDIVWAPDSTRIAFTAMLKADGIQPEVKEEKEDDLLKKHTKNVKTITEMTHKMDGMGYFGERRPCLCVTTLEDGAQVLQLTQPPYSVFDFNWTPDSKQLVFSSRLGADYDTEAFEGKFYVIAAEGGEARQLTPDHLPGGSASVSPDGQTVAYLFEHPEDLGYGNGTIGLIPLAGGEVTPIAREFDRAYGNQAINDMPAPGGWHLTWAPDGKSLFALISDHGTAQIAQIEVATGTVTLLTKGDHVVYSVSLDARCRKAAIGKAEPLNPADLYWVDLREGTEERLTRINEALLAELELSEPKRFLAQAAGGPLLDGWVMKPHGFAEGTKYPTILTIHGGPMGMYGAAFFFEFQLLAAQGFGVVFSNPRGSLGYGAAHCKAIMKEWGNKDYADVMAALDQAIANNDWIDTDRLGVTGGSYGGFMTNWIVGHTDRFKAAVTGRSICNWSTMALTTDGPAYWFKRASGAMPWSGDDWYRQQSPLTYVENVVTPILIEHQEGDLRCPVEQGQMWYAAIKYLGKAPVRFVTYPGEFHGMSRNGKPWNRVHRLNEITGWFQKYLAPQA